MVSYSHIYGLGRAHGRDGTPARLLPPSVNGLILAASLVLLHEARNGRDAPRLARFMLWLGIGANIGVLDGGTADGSGPRRALKRRGCRRDGSIAWRSGCRGRVVFLHGDATPLAAPFFSGWLFINPYRTTILRLGLSSDWLIRQIYPCPSG